MKFSDARNIECLDLQYCRLVTEARRLWAQRSPDALFEVIRIYEETVAHVPGNSPGG